MRVAREVRRGQVAVYHVRCRTVGGEYLLGQQEREALRRRMRKLGKFLGIIIHTHSFLSNHLHLIPRVPAKITLSDPELLRALEDYYGAKDWRTIQFEHLCRQPQSPELARVRAGYLRRMGDLSTFMKEFKEGFSKWFNQKQGRFGTLWAERFRSSLVSEWDLALLLKAAYVDLNSVRAGQVKDPLDDLYCGYAEAVARAGPAREGLSMILPGQSWEEKQAGYRQLLHGEGQWAPKEGAAILDPARVLKVIQEGGQVSLSQILRVQVRYLEEEIAFGTKEFVDGVFAQFRQKRCKRRQQGSWPIDQGADWKGLTTLKKIKEPFAAPAQLPPDPAEEPAKPAGA